MNPLQYIKFFEGKSNNAHLISFDNGKQYVIKFLKKGQEKILLNEWLGYCIARYMNLPIPPSRLVDLPEAFLENIDQKDDVIFTSKQFGTLYIPDCKNAHELQNPRVANAEQLAGIIVLDYWLYNTDRTRKNILFKDISQTEQYLYIIDHGDLFGSFAWEKGDLEAINTHLLKSATHELIASLIKDKNDFYKQLHTIQAIPTLLLREILDFPPDDWGTSKDEKEALVKFLIYRRDKELPAIIEKFISHNLTL